MIIELDKEEICKAVCDWLTAKGATFPDPHCVDFQFVYRVENGTTTLKSLKVTVAEPQSCSPS